MYQRIHVVVFYLIETLEKSNLIYGRRKHIRVYLGLAGLAWMGH